MKLSEIGANASPEVPQDDQPKPLKLSQVAAQPEPTPAKPMKLSQVPAAPPPAAPTKNDSGILSQVGKFVGDTVKNAPGAAVAGVKDIIKETTDRGSQSFQDIKGDLTAPVQSHDKDKKPGKPGAMDYAARAGKTALDVANVPFNLAAGPISSVIGRPIEELSGGKIKKENVGDAATIAYPLSKVGMVSKADEIITDGAKALEKVFSPTSVSPEAGAAERTIRRASGQGSIEAEKAAAKLVGDNKIVSNLPVPEQRALVDYIENRSKGAKLANPALQATADKIAQVYDTYKSRINKILPATQSQKFIDDYYVHMWKENPTIVKDKIGAFMKQGSGRNLKARTIPTIADGIKAGLTPVTENPIEATSAYAQNMSRFLATHDIQNELKAQGYAKWYTPGSAKVPKGWVPLDGIMTSKVAPVTAGTAKASAGLAKGRPIQLFAPPDVARVYNNFISKGLEQGDAGPLYTGARKLANGLTMLKLGLSTFHLDTMANESVTSGFARAFQNLSRGDIKGAGKAAGTAVAKPVIDYRRGMKMQRELLDQKMPDAISSKVNDAFVRSGGRIKMDPFYRTRSSGSFFNAIEKGTFKRELTDAAKKMYQGTAYDKAKGIVDMGANIIQSTAAPLFEKYIPAVKRGAFASSMEDFIKANPKATQEELDKYAIKLSDSIDNRFGELVQDNLFWKKQMKQAAQILLLSPTWDLGTVREIGGGLKDALHAPADIIKGKGISDRTAYVAGLATEVALKNAIYTYMKTGTAPKGEDYMAGRTGGTDIASGKPERALTPGYEKDVYAFGYDFPHNVLQESVNKLNPGLSAATGLLTNKDYRGLPIYRPEGVKPQPGEPGLPDFLMDTLMPISIGQFKSGKKGTNISPAERAILADRPAPAYMTDPQRVEQLKSKFNTRDWRARIKADQKQRSQQQ